MAIDFWFLIYNLSMSMNGQDGNASEILDKP